MKTLLNVNRDNIGNRKVIKQVKIPEDDIGNKAIFTQAAKILPDNIGNIKYKFEHHPNEQIKREGTYIQNYIENKITNPKSFTNKIINAEHSQTDQTIKKEKVSPEKTNKSLLKLFEVNQNISDENKFSTAPEKKLVELEYTLKKLLKTGGLVDDTRISVEQEEKTPFLHAVINEPIFKNNDLALSALNFLVDKILNKATNDRVKIKISS